MKTRIEHDPLGKKKVPSDAYFGVHTQRARENFPISDKRMDLELYHAIATIKLATCRANTGLGLLDKKRSRVIQKATQEVLKGTFDDHFVMDVYQAGAGTPTHMNVNEVIANRAIELLRGKKGDYTIVHPNDHVNMGQSTNDVFPSAMRLALIVLAKKLSKSLTVTEKTLRNKAQQWKSIVKSGRTHLQDAVPIRFEQEVGAWATAVGKQRVRLENAAKQLHHISMGGNAIGTGINTKKAYRGKVIKELKKITKLPLQPTKDLFEGTQSMGDLLHYSSALRSIAVELTKIANDLRLLGSGPRTGFNEVMLPAVEPGSSIMPGKVNPSMLEMLNMVCFQVMGHDRTVELAAQAGQLELNVMMPIIAHNLIQSTKILTTALAEVEKRCLRRMDVNKAATHYNLECTLALATFLNPYIGYEKAAVVAEQAHKEHKSVLTVIREQKLLTEEQIKKLLNPKNVTEPNL